MKETILTLDLRWIKLQTNPITSLFHLSSDKVVQLGFGGVLDFQVKTWNEVLFQWFLESKNSHGLRLWCIRESKNWKGGESVCTRFQTWSEKMFEIPDLSPDFFSSHFTFIKSHKGVQKWRGGVSSEQSPDFLWKDWSRVLPRRIKWTFL